MHQQQHALQPERTDGQPGSCLEAVQQMRQPLREPAAAPAAVLRSRGSARSCVRINQESATMATTLAIDSGEEDSR